MPDTINISTVNIYIEPAVPEQHISVAPPSINLDELREAGEEAWPDLHSHPKTHADHTSPHDDCLECGEAVAHNTQVEDEWEPTPELSKGEQVLEKFIDRLRSQFQVLVSEGYMNEDHTEDADDSNLDMVKRNYENFTEEITKVRDQERTFTDDELNPKIYTPLDAAANVAIYSALALYQYGGIKL